MGAVKGIRVNSSNVLPKGISINNSKKRTNCIELVLCNDELSLDICSLILFLTEYPLIYTVALRY